ncbi:hypothetical protein LTR06_006000 [Exophiala xenobiotica]|nr:hypothetical protein LTR06_006000 [Exophiala xenobiotica]
MAIPARPTNWPQPNYIDPETRGSPSLFVVMMVISTIVVLLRLYSRRYLTKSLGLDDALLLAGWFLSIGMTFAEYKAMTTWGWNKHIWDIPPERLPKLRIAAWLIEFFFLSGTACTKISILFFYRRLTSGIPSFWFLYLTWAAIAFTVSYTIGLLVELFVICRPLTSYWESYSPTYDKKFTCANEHVPFLFSAAASVTSDVYTVVLPMLLVRKLQMTCRQRLSMYALFSAGLLTAGTGVARLIVFIPATTNYQPGPHIDDVSWLGWPLLALTDLEAHLAIIIASLPALKVFFRRRVSGQLTKMRGSIRTMSTSSGAQLATTIRPGQMVEEPAPVAMNWSKQPVHGDIAPCSPLSPCSDGRSASFGTVETLAIDTPNMPRYVDVVQAARMPKCARVETV